MKLEKQTLNFGKKVIKEQILSIQKVQKSLNLNFSKAVSLIHNTKGNIVFTGVGNQSLFLKKHVVLFLH